MKRRIIAAALVCMAAIAGIGSAARAETVDLLLVLAADVSRSIDDEEFNLQRKGYANAITDPEVLSAIIGGKHHAIAVTFVEWSGAGEQNVVIDWTVVRDGEAAAAIASSIMSAPRSFVGRTAIGAAIDFAVQRLQASPAQSERQVIDVSGDGTSNSGRPVTEARDEAVAAGITINGLAIVNNRSTPGLRVPHATAGRAAEILPGERDRRSRRISDHGRGFPQLRRRDHPQAGRRDRRDFRYRSPPVGRPAVIRRERG